MNLFLLQAAAPEAAKGGLMGGSWGTIIVIEIAKDVQIRVDKSSVYAAGEDVAAQK